MRDALTRVRVVLLRPAHPGNIGAVARVMGNMGLSDLRLVAPLVFPSPIASARAAGADHILERAQVVERLDDALADCTWVVGATARARTQQASSLAPDAAMAELLDARHTHVALLFGPERSGLDNDALRRCQRTTRISVDPAFTSLNLAAAVTVMLYELRRQAGQLSDGPSELAGHNTAADAPGTASELRFLVEHLRRVVERSSTDPARAASVVKKLTRMLNRAAPEHGEVQLLRGLLTSAEARLIAESDAPKHA